jgi:hypothetical protein
VEWGLFKWNNIGCEVGADYWAGKNHPLYFNAKLGIDEGKICHYAPSLSVGILGVGTRTHGHRKTNDNIADIVLGKALPECIGGKFFVGAFSGTKTMGHTRQGWMAAYERGFYLVKDAAGKEYAKWDFYADYASGKNALGGGGFAIAYNFTPDISLETGPIWFNDHHLYGRWKWGLQLALGF